MPNVTHAEVAARLLREAATFCLTVGKNNAPLKAHMKENAEVLKAVALLVEADSMGIAEGVVV